MPVITVICLAIALHDVDGPIHCQDGTKVRLQGIGATEMDGTCRPNQPCVPGDPFEQRRRMAKAMGATIARETRSPNGGQLYFARPIRLAIEPTGKSHNGSLPGRDCPTGEICRASQFARALQSDGIDMTGAAG